MREAEERDEGYIAGSRHMPYRLLGAVSDGLGDLPVVTICSTGARAAIAASLLAAHGIDARPVRRRRRGRLGSPRRPHDRVPPLRLVGKLLRPAPV